MKTPGLLFASIFTAFSLTGCQPLDDPDDLLGPPADPPPLCTVVGLTLQEAMVTSSRGGSADMSLTVSNSSGCATAYNLSADVVAEQSNQWVGETSVNFDALEGGRSAGASITLPVSGLPDAAYCTLTWYDDAGDKYTAAVRSDLYGGLWLSTPVTGGVSKVH